MCLVRMELIQNVLRESRCSGGLCRAAVERGRGPERDREECCHNRAGLGC